MKNETFILYGAGAVLVLFLFNRNTPASGAVNSRVYNWTAEAERASQITKIPANVILAVISQESQGDPDAIGFSVGEIGLMQLTKDAVIDVGYDRIPRDPAENILAGAKYLSLLINENDNLFDALRAYNFGRTRVRNGSAGGAGYANEVLEKLKTIDGKRGSR